MAYKEKRAPSPIWERRAKIRVYGRDVMSSQVWKYMQSVKHHGDISRSLHCEDVAAEALVLAERFGITVSEKEMVRAALLHDAFYYDWKVQGERRAFHAFVHGTIAARTAAGEVPLTRKECNCIRAHMFPAALGIPLSREAWLITIADKICSVREYKEAYGTDSFLKAFVMVRLLKRARAG